MSLTTSSTPDSARVIELLERVVELLEGRGVPTAQPPASLAAEMIDLGQLAVLLHKSERTVRRMRRSGELPPPTVSGRQPRWTRSVIDAWLAQRRPR